jgi:hypothetical protein
VVIVGLLVGLGPRDGILISAGRKVSVSSMVIRDMEAHHQAGVMVTPAATQPQERRWRPRIPLPSSINTSRASTASSRWCPRTKRTAPTSPRRRSHARFVVQRYEPSKGSLEGWLWRIVVNVAQDAGRASARRQSLRERLGGQVVLASTSVEDEVLKQLDDVALLMAVRALPKRARTLVALRFGANLTYPEIAQQLGLTPQAALRRGAPSRNCGAL